MTSKSKIAVLIPCLNEAQTIHKVVTDFRRVLPQAAIFVYDNASSDATAETARSAGAIVRTEERRGKGNVVRRMFSDIDADIYVMVDGDDTYDATSAPLLIDRLLDGPYDMVNGARVSGATNAYRPGHAFGNKLLTGLVRAIFGAATVDMLSGYKVLSRRYVKSFPAFSRGFETETELIVHALELRMPVSEIATPYGERPVGSASKLKTVRDALRILRLIGILIKEERPLGFFSAIAGVLAAISLILGIPVVLEFLQTGLVPRFPTAILATGFMLSALLSLSCGFILDTVTRGRREIKRLFYLRYSPPVGRDPS